MSKDRGYIVLGHDPGASGGFAVMTSNGDLLGVLDTPVVHLDKKTFFDCGEFFLWYKEVTKPYPTLLEFACIEAVGSMPKQGVSSTFNFGSMYGGAASYLMLQFGIERVWFETPQKWKKTMGLTGDKARSIELATDEFGPDVADEFWPLAKHDGRAEAALLCCYYIDHVHATREDI